MRNQLWTYLTVTGVTLIIWFYAEAATREQDQFRLNAEFGVGGDGVSWTITPRTRSINAIVEGSPRDIRAARDLRNEVLSIDVPQEPGTHEIDLATRLPQLDVFRGTGVTLISVEPAMLNVDVDRIETATATVRPVLPNVQTEGKIELRPAEVALRLPGRKREQLTEDLHVEAFVNPSVLDGLPPGVRHTRRVRLRLPEALASLESIDGVEIVPEQATITFTLRSRIRELALDAPVRVHVAGPPEDFMEYDIELEPSALRNVTISADADVIRLVESREATVVAVLHLSNQDKAQAIPSKPVAYFEVLREGWTRGVPVEGRVEGSDEPPVIGLTISRRQ